MNLYFQFKTKGILELNLWCKISRPHLVTAVWSAASNVWSDLQELNSKLGIYVTEHLMSKKFRWSSRPLQTDRQTDKESSSQPFYTYFGLVQIAPGRRLFVSIGCEEWYELDAELIRLGLGERHWNHLNNYVYLGLLSIWTFISRISWCCEFQGMQRTDSGVSSDLMSLLLSGVFIFRKWLPFNHEHNSRITKMMEEKKGRLPLLHS